MLGLGDNLAQSTSALRAYRLRSALTIIGLVMGVATIIGVISLIRGANQYVEEKVANLGTNVFQISKTPFVSTNFEQLVRAVRYRRIDEETMRFLSDKCRNCTAVGATLASTVRARRGNAELTDVQLQGATSSMAEIDPRAMAKGRYFTPAEDERSGYVCLIGEGVREQLFGLAEGVGQTMRLGNQEFLVVGVFEKIGSVLGQDSDTFIVVPMSTYGRVRGNGQSLTLSVKAASAETLSDALDESRALLRSKRQVRAGQPDDFFFGTREAYIALWTYISAAFFRVFVVVSLISSIVGGVVIMNVMLVSVTERAKEIGLRRALGATQRDIRKQFLTESLLQCVVGGLLGVAGGFLAAEAVRMLAAFPVRVELWVAALGVGLSSLIGLFFGLAPAVRAARLDPAEALRAE